MFTSESDSTQYRSIPTVLGLLFSVFPLVALHAGPSHQSPKAPMDAMGISAEAKPLIAQCSSLAAEIVDELAELSAPDAQQKNRNAARDIMQTRNKIFQAYEIALLLQSMHEPAGTNLERLVLGLHRPANSVGAASRGTPSGQKTAARSLADLQKSKPKRDKLMAKTMGIAQQGKFAEAYKLLYPDMQAVWSNRILHPHTTVDPLTKDFIAHYRSVKDKYFRKKQQSYQNEYIASMQKHAKLILTYQEKLPAVTQAVLQSESGQLDAQTVLNGFDAIVKAWQNTSVSVVRLETMRFLLKKKGRNDLPTSPMDDQTLMNISVDALTKIISQAADSVPTEEVSTLHTGLLDRASLLQQRISKASFRDRSTPDGKASQNTALPTLLVDAISKLAERDPSLNSHKKAFAIATDQWLDWTQRRTSQVVSVYEKQMTDSSKLLPSRAEATVAARLPIFPAYQPKDPINADGYLSHWSAHHANETSQRLLKHPISVQHLQSMPGSTMAVSWTLPTTGSNGAPHHYAMVNVPEWDTGVQQMLDTFLLVSEENPPLTPAAAIARSQWSGSARSCVGGVISGVTLETSLARFAAMTPSVAVLVPLDSPGQTAVQHLGYEQSSPEQVALWRLTVSPTWMATDHAFIALNRR